MMPVVPTAKRSHGFTIDSLMSKDTPSSHLRDARPPPPGPQPQQMPPRSPRSPRSRSSPDITPTRPSSSGRAPTPSSRGPTSSTPINLTASAEAATVPLREGLFGGGSGSSNGGGHVGGGLPSSFHPVHSNAALLNSMKSLYAHEHAAAYPDGLAAAAALGFPVPLAATTAPGLPGGFTPPGHPGFTGAHPLLLGPHHREHFNLYPWLMSRHGGYFGHGRFPGPDATHLLLQPFRKPKRIRTAFSPSQLLRLEHAFEKNHYVVGQERKDLANNLSLTETQVKVWFQNRRTKYKRMKAEESEGGSGGGRDPRSPGSPRSDGRADHEDDDDDMPLDVSSNPGEEEELEMVDDEDEEIIDCVTSPEEEDERREAMGDPRMLMMSGSLIRDNVLSNSMVGSMSSSGMHHNRNHDPRLLQQQQQAPPSPIPPQPSHHKIEQLSTAHNDSLHKGDRQVSSNRPPPPPRSPSPTSAKTAHHVERWRSETNQVQAV